MAPSNWDNHIKESLEKRQLQPSQDAWSKLQSRLESEEKKKKRTVFWWIGMAASIVGIVFISTLFFNKNEQTVNKIVDAPTANVEKIQDIKPVIANETVVSRDEIIETPKPETEKQIQIINVSKASKEKITPPPKKNRLKNGKKLLRTFYVFILVYKMKATI